MFLRRRQERAGRQLRGGSRVRLLRTVSTKKQVIDALACNGEFADMIAFIAGGGWLDVRPLITGYIGLEDIIGHGFEESMRSAFPTDLSHR